MTNRFISGKDSLSVTAFLQEFKYAYDACIVHEGTVLRLLKQFLTDPVEVVVKSRILLPILVSAAMGEIYTHITQLSNSCHKV